MAIRELSETAVVEGPVTRVMVEVTEEGTDPVVDWEVSCIALGCERYACTHLTEDEAIAEVAEHGNRHKNKAKTDWYYKHQTVESEAADVRARRREA